MDIGSGATILVNVELEGIEQGKAALAAFGTTGEASAKRVQEAYQRVAASAADFARAGANAAQIARLTGSSMQEAREAAQLYAKTLATSQEDVRGLKAANQELAEAGLLKVTNAFEKHGHAAHGSAAAMTHLRTEMGMAARETLALNPVVEKLGVLLGHMSISDTVLIGILAGITAVGFAWEKLTEESKKAKEEQEKLTKALKDWYELEKLGVGGERVRQLEAQEKAVKALADEYARLKGLAEDASKAEQKAGTTGTNALFGQYAGGAGSSNAFFQGMAGGVGSTNAFFTAQANGANAAAAAIEHKAAKEIEDAAALDLLKQRTFAWVDAAGAQLHYLELLTANIPSIDKLTVSYSKLTGQLLANEKAAIATQAIWLQMAKPQVATIPEAPVDWQAVFALPSEAEARKYADDIAHIWGDGIEKMLTDGLKSWHDFFEDVFQLFSALMKRMQQENNASGLGFNALRLGSAGLAGGIAGYGAGSQVGSMVGSGGLKSALLGSFSGAAAGAAAGTAILPGIGTVVGTVVGELAGLAGALLSGSKAAKERKEAEEQLRQSLTASIAAQKALLGIISPLDAALAQNVAVFKQLRDETEKAYAGRKNEAEREMKLRELDSLERQRAQQIADEAAKQAAAAAEEAARQVQAFAEAMADAAAQAAEALRQLNQESQQSSLLRFFDATGQSDLAFALRQAIEIQQAIAKRLDDLSIAMIRQAQQAEADQRRQQQADAENRRIQQAQLDTLQNQAQLLQQSISTQQEIVNQTRQAADALRKYSDALKLNPALTPLGPEERYNEAKRQYLAISNAAAGGDLNAAAQLPDIANAFLEQSRNMFASTDRYRQDYQQVQAMIGALADRYGQQLTYEQQVLAQMKAQLAALQAQLDVARQTLDATKANKPTAPDDTQPVKIPERPTWWFDPNPNPSTDPVRRPRVGDPDDPIRKNLEGILSRLGSMHVDVIATKDHVAGVRASAAYTADASANQTNLQAQIRDNTKATVDGIGKLRPIDVGGPIR